MSDHEDREEDQEEDESVEASTGDILVLEDKNTTIISEFIFLDYRRLRQTCTCISLNGKVVSLECDRWRFHDKRSIFDKKEN